MLFFFFSFLIYLQKRERNPLKLCQGRTLLDDARHGCKLMTLNCAVQQAEGGGLDEWGGGRGVLTINKNIIVYISKQNRPLSRLHLDKTSRHGVCISPEEFTLDRATGRRIEGRKKYPMFSVSIDGGWSDELPLKTEQNGVQQHSEFCWIIIFNAPLFFIHWIWECILQ